MFHAIHSLLRYGAISTDEWYCYCFFSFRMKWSLLGVLAIVCCSVENVSGARILAFLPFPAKSHHRVFTPILRELLKNGHQVTSVTPISMTDPPPNYREILIPDIMKELLSKWYFITPRNQHQGTGCKELLSTIIQRSLTSEMNF